MFHVRVKTSMLVMLVGISLVVLSPVAGAALDPGGTFADDNDSIHESAIEAIADVGITRGCNPPVNDLFCPTSSVTREQMASFLVRALGLPAGSSSFTDTAGSVHEADIAALAAAGITLGCNPPVNDMFCPRDPVTREQMASFLARALNLTLIDPPPPLPQPSPSPLVVYGSDNWLYFAETVEQSCLDAAVLPRLVSEIAKAKEIVETSGRAFVYAIPPDKAVINDENLASWSGSCAESNSLALQAALSSAADPNRVDLWAPFAAAAEQIYWKHDTHWNAEGALLGSELIATKAAPGLWAAFGIESSPASRQGDLAEIIGVDWVIDYDDLTPALPGVIPTETIESASISGRPLVSYSSTGSSDLSSLRTAVIHDSFGYHVRNKLGPLFEDVTFLPTFSHPISDDARPFVANSDQVVLEIVERNVLRDFLGTGTAGHLAAALADDFTQAAAPFTRDGDEVVFTIPAGSANDLRYLIVNTTTTSTVVTGSASDFTAPAWPNEITAEASRYGFEIVGTPTSLRLPLPASVNVTSAFVIVIE